MKKVIFAFFAVSMLFAGCAKAPRRSMEEEYRLRQERRRREAKQRREDKITSLSGLNEFELNELEKSKKQNDLNPNPGNFVFSPRENNPHGSGKILDELNDDDKQRVNKYRKSVKQKEKSGRSRVYGL